MSELEDKEKIIAGLFEVKGRLFDAKGNTQLTPIVMKIWLGHVREYTADQVLDAVMKYTSKQFAKTLDISDFLTCLNVCDADSKKASIIKRLFALRGKTGELTGDVFDFWMRSFTRISDENFAYAANEYVNNDRSQGVPLISGVKAFLPKQAPYHSESAPNIKRLPQGPIMSAIAHIAGNNKNNAAKLEEMRAAIRSATPEKAKREYAKLRKAVIA